MEYKKAKKYELYKQWDSPTKEAYLYDKLDGQKTQCRVCPRNCIISKDQVGFCKVKKNIDGTLFALSYEKAVQMTTEFIETEAIFHYSPGEKILSLGNFGCNLDCSYCQNWNYSQFQYTSPDSIYNYTSEDIIKRAKEEGIKVLSWTYNDPAVWYEFVLDTAKKAREAGLQNLFKSAMYLSEEALKELMPYMDIVAVSIKSMDAEYYKTFTKGEVGPVLDATKYIHYNYPQAHLEISNLVVTGISNNEESYQKMISFVLDELSPDVPLHFTRFHPAYKYENIERTPIEDVAKARQMALEAGIKHSYIGNIFEHEGINTYCPKCKHLLIERFGLKTNIIGLNNNRCEKCGEEILIKQI